jgi:hypothetical protein
MCFLKIELPNINILANLSAKIAYKIKIPEPITASGICFIIFIQKL